MGVPPLHAPAGGELGSWATACYAYYPVWENRGAAEFQQFISDLHSAPEGAKVFIRPGWQLGSLPKPRSESGS